MTEPRTLPPVAGSMLTGIYEHRLLSTTQLHALYAPAAQPRWARQVLVLLERRGFVDRIRSPRRLSLWFLTDTGADAVEAGGARLELRRRVTSRAQAEGPLKKHTIAVNQVGVEFVRAAREREDECGPGSWRNEVAHPISQARGRRPAELVIADALLTYLETSSDGALALHQRFIELDRGTRTTEQLAGKITKYARLRHYAPPTTSGEMAPEPLWRSYYRAWPHLLVVLADQSRATMRQRVRRTLALQASDPAGRVGQVPVAFVALDDLSARGPFAPIFLTAHQPEQCVDWLGEPRPKEQQNNGFH
ncbi:MAG TPA: replication-relaxation family protein [Solirubrobacteraceae bacterium]|nr:replication-relaxation family protein [Solirubrobacteraceae bacterium]